MKNKTLVVGLLTGVLSVALMFPKTGLAFWPFDQWFQKGEVKGEQTEIKKSNSIRDFFQGATPTPTPIVAGADEQERLEKGLTGEKLNRAVKGKIISEANRKEMLAKLAEIKARREALKKLQQEFVAWMRANRIDPKAIDGTESTETTETKATPEVRRPEVSGTPGIRKPESGSSRGIKTVREVTNEN